MILNGDYLLNAQPFSHMETTKIRHQGASFGLSEAGYDIRINQDVLFIPGTWWRKPKVIVTSYDNKYEHPNDTVHRGRFCLASAIERFQMPNNLVGVVHDKSTHARKSLSVFNTVIEPGWNGFLTLELVFNGEEKVFIERGTGIAQVLFATLAQKGDYGDGKYQNAGNFPQKALG